MSILHSWMICIVVVSTPVVWHANPEQQAVLEQSPPEGVHCVGAFVGEEVGAEVGLAVTGELVGLPVGVLVGLMGLIVGGSKLDTKTCSSVQKE